MPLPAADPDMLGVGMTGISDVEGRSQFSLWVILAAPLFLGTDVRRMSAATFATISNAEAIAINQDALGVQGALVNGNGMRPVPYAGGEKANLTACAPKESASLWSLTSDGHLVSSASQQCVTTVACGAQSGDPVFIYDCVSNGCGNELWSWRSAADNATGQLVSLVQGGVNVCLAGVDPGLQPFSQLELKTCDISDPFQMWGRSAPLTEAGMLSLAPPSGPLCMTEFGPPAISLYAKPLAPRMGSQDVALAVLNRGSTTAAAGYTVDFAALGFAPAQPIVVRDIWANSTSAVAFGSYATRAIASHETLLLRVSLAL